MSAIAFDASTVAPQSPRIAWPKGKFRIAITHSEVKDVGAQNSGNKGVQFGAKALEVIGAAPGTPVPDSALLWNVNFMNKSADAQRIGQAELSSVCHATGVLKLTDTANLHGHPFIVEVDTEFVQGKNEDGSKKVNAVTGQPEGITYNRVTGYYKNDGSPVVGSAAPGAAAPAAAGPPPAWAAAMASQAPAPVPPAAPAPLPVAAAPVSLPPAPAPAQPQLYYVNHKGQLVTPQPVSATSVHALGLAAAEIDVNPYGTQQWIKGTDFFAAQAPAAAPTPPVPAETPPWMQKQQ